VNRLDKLLNRVVLGFWAAPRGREPRERPELVHPGDRQVRTGRLILSYSMAVLVPASVAALLIPARADHLAFAAVVMVVPVVAIAAVGTTGPAVVAAASAALAFDVFLTQPYYRFVITDPDDIAAAVALGVVGLIVGVLSSRLAHLLVSDDARRSELSHLIGFIGEAEAATSVDELSALVCGHMVDLLGLRTCEWLPQVQEASGPLLLSSGALMGRLTELNPDRGKLPHRVQVPIMIAGRQHGCFSMVSNDDRLTSIEERRTAATIAEIFGRSAQALSD